MMEISVGQYGHYMFETMCGQPEDMPPHWRSIREKAEPLVAELIRLNDEMKPNGYKLTGQLPGGKIQQTEFNRIRKTQELLWGVEASALNDDLVWLVDSDYEMYIHQDSPCPVEFIKKDGTVVVSVGDYRGQVCRLRPTDVVLRAPSDWEENESTYNKKHYWLEQADRLGI